MRWFKMDVGLPTDSKILTLPDDRHRWLWVCVLCSAGKERKSGFIGTSYDARYFSRITDFTETEVTDALKKLAANGGRLIEIKPEGIQVLNWSQWQSDAEYMAGYRGGKSEGLQSKKKNLTKLGEDKNRLDKKRIDKKVNNKGGKYIEWLNAWNENSPGPKHETLGSDGVRFIGLLTTEGAADGIVWTLEMFTEAVTIYRKAIEAGFWGYKWPSLPNLLSRTYYQKTGPGLTHFLPRDGYNPYKDLGLQKKDQRR